MYDPLNYREILHVTCTAYSAVLGPKNKNVLNDEQNGFRKLRSCMERNMHYTPR